ESVGGPSQGRPQPRPAPLAIHGRLGAEWRFCRCPHEAGFLHEFPSKAPPGFSRGYRAYEQEKKEGTRRETPNSVKGRTWPGTKKGRADGKRTGRRRKVV